MSTQLIDEVAIIVEEPASSLTLDTELSTLPMWDSLAVVSFMAMAKTKFGVSVTPKQLMAAAKIADLAAMIGA